MPSNLHFRANSETDQVSVPPLSGSLAVIVVPLMPVRTTTCSPKFATTGSPIGVRHLRYGPCERPIHAITGLPARSRSTIALTFRLLDAIKLFDVIYVMTGGGPGSSTYTASYYLYQIGFQQFHLSKATAGSWIFLILSAILIMALVRRLLRPEVR